MDPEEILEEQEEETQPETSTEEPEGEPSAEEDPLARYGLSDRFKTVDDVLESYRNAEGELTRLQQEQANWKRERETFVNMISRVKTPEPQVNPDEVVERFNTDPINSLRSAGFVTKEDLNTINETIQQAQRAQQANDLASFMAEHDDLKDAASYVRSNKTLPTTGQYPAWDRLMAAYYRTGLAGQTKDDIAVLRLIAPQVFPAKKPSVPPVPPDKKERAQTAGGQRRTSGAPDYRSMTAQQILDDMTKRGLITE